MFDLVLTTQGKILLIAVCLVFLIGVFLIFTSLIVFSPRRYRKTIKSYREVKVKNKRSANIDDALHQFSKRFAQYIHINDIERARLQKALQISGNAESPEEYNAYLYTVFGAFLLVALLVLMVGIASGQMLFKILAVVIAACGGIAMYLSKRKLNVSQKEAVLGIERELPRFVSFLKQSLTVRKESTLAMVSRYTAIEPAFATELQQTLADAKTSSFSAAFARFDQRINSDRLKMVIHGLISANNGDDVLVYFAMLERDFTEHEISMLRKNIKSIPSKMRVPKFLLYTSIFASLFFPLIMQVVESFISVFGSI